MQPRKIFFLTVKIMNFTIQFKKNYPKCALKKLKYAKYNYIYRESLDHEIHFSIN